MSKKISIVTICRNAGSEVRKTIESVLDQTYSNIEYIFIDGLSDDPITTGIIQEYKSRFHFFVSEKDSGIYNAMNKGLSKATGDFIIFLNAGDRLSDPICMEAVMNLMEKKESDLYFADVVWVDLSKKVVKPGLPDIVFTDDLYDKNFPHPGTFYKKSVFEKYGPFDESYKILADYELNLRLLITHKLSFAVLNVLVSFFYTGGISTSLSNKTLRDQEMEQIRGKYFKVKPSGSKNQNGILKRWSGEKREKLNRVS